jgi:hypothetical protein
LTAPGRSDEVEFEAPAMPSPKRVVLLGTMTDAWYEAGDEERRTAILPRFAGLVEEWQELGARVLATLDDDLFMVGRPGPGRATFYLMFDVDDLDTVVKMIQRIRVPVGGVRMDRYVGFEARIGRPFFLLEPSPPA